MHIYARMALSVISAEFHSGETTWAWYQHMVDRCWCIHNRLNIENTP